MDFCAGGWPTSSGRARSTSSPQLPKNGNGKLSRKDVREPYWHGRERRVN